MNRSPFLKYRRLVAEKMCVHVIDRMVRRQSIAEWKANNIPRWTESNESPEGLRAKFLSVEHLDAVSCVSRVQLNVYVDQILRRDTEKACIQILNKKSYLQ